MYWKKKVIFNILKNNIISTGSYDSWDYNVRENPDLINEPVPELYKISPRGKTFSRPKVLPSVLENNG